MVSARIDDLLAGWLRIVGSTNFCALSTVTESLVSLGIALEKLERPGVDEDSAIAQSLVLETLVGKNDERNDETSTVDQK